MASNDELRRALRSAAPGQPDRFYHALAAAVRAGLFEAALDALDRLPAVLRNEPRFLQQHGLAKRGLLDSAEAHAAFAAAAALAPDDPLIAHSLARTALDAGLPSAALFGAARALAPHDAAVLLGRAAALLAEGDWHAAAAELATTLQANPGWIDGHLGYARLVTPFSPGEAPAKTLRDALNNHPQSAELWYALIRVKLGAQDYRAAHDVAAQARGVLGAQAALDRLEAHCLGELGDADAAQTLFDRMPLPLDGDAVVPMLRNLIRLGRLGDAARLAENPFPEPGDQAVWPYRALLWRLSGDPRWEWLEGGKQLIRSYDIATELGDLHTLAACLRAVHNAGAQPLDQSVRGGTQTDGNLFARAEPEIRQLRHAVTAAVADYVGQLPQPDPRHPTLLATRTPIRFAGSWSVRLTGAGFHEDHVHTQGWISSACYIALPDTAGDAAEAGHLTFGENRRLLPDLAGFRTVEPIAGRLVLFPSTMWHGTRPFAAGERLTAAFDIARPQR